MTGRAGLPVVWTFIMVSYPLIKGYRLWGIHTAVSLMDFPTFPFESLFSFHHPACQLFTIQPILHTFRPLYFHIHPVIFCNYRPPFLFDITHSTIPFPTNKTVLSVALVALAVALQTPKSADLLWLCSCLIFLHFIAANCRCTLFFFFFFSSIKDVSVCDIVGRGGGGVEAKLFHLQQLKTGSIPM